MTGPRSGLLESSSGGMFNGVRCRSPLPKPAVSARPMARLRRVVVAVREPDTLLVDGKGSRLREGRLEMGNHIQAALVLS